MSKKSRAAEAAEVVEQIEAGSQQSLDATVQTSEQPPAGSADAQPPSMVRGRALLDIPAHDLKCGEYGELPEQIAAALAIDGQFDLKAAEI